MPCRSEGDPVVESELAAEQAHLDRAYDRLAVLQEQARKMYVEQQAEYSRTPSGMLERDVREAHGVRRFGSLRVDGGLCFGRIDRSDGETFHVGRIGVSDEDLTPIVVDWRAPVAEPFYRATPLDNLGLLRRRHLLTRGRRVVGIEDEALAIDSSEAERRGLVLVGEAALLGALTERRTGRMRDIVATIQAEQDAIIRSALAGVLVVQGGPGTGKTAVALHRAAYLLFRHRFPLEEQGVLVVGPNPLFLRYIERVLPSLGESRCRMTTIDGVHRLRPSAAETDPRVESLKGDLRMAGVVAAAVAGRQRPLPRRVRVPVGAHRLPIGPRATAAIVEGARSRPGTHNERHALVARSIVRHLARQYDAAVENARSAGLPAEALARSEVVERLRSSAAVREVIDRVWPLLTAEEVVGSLYDHPPLLRAASEGVLSDTERDLLARKGSAGWTASDLPLLDEADVLLGRRHVTRSRRSSTVEDASVMVDRVLAGQLPFCPTCDSELTFDVDRQLWLCDRTSCGSAYRSEEVMSPAAATQVRDLQRLLRERTGADDVQEPEAWFASYGHVVVDEAQELSPMQWRMLARRCPTTSMTIVGDLAQGSSPSAARSWDEVRDALGIDNDDERVAARWRVVELTVNYRTPQEVVDLADRVLAASGAPISTTPARSVRSTGEAPSMIVAADLIAVTARVVSTERIAVDGGKIAVIAPPELVVALRAGVSDPIAPEDERSPLDVLDEAVAVIDPESAKGLEFDSVVIVEPSAFGPRALYVALTRTTTRLTIVHQQPLPAGLAAGT